jgi:hypothetical protein
MGRPYHNILKFKDDKISIMARVDLHRLTAEQIISPVENYTHTFDPPPPGAIFAKQRSTGLRVKTAVVDKETGRFLPMGYARIWINEKQEIVDEEEIEYFQKTEGGERRIRQYEPTLGKDRVMIPERIIPLTDIDLYLVEAVYEITGRDQSDDEALFELAQYMIEKDIAIVYPFVIRAGWKKYWAIVYPNIQGDKFNFLARIIQAKIEYQHWSTVPGARPKIEKIPTLTKKTPFE